MKQPSEESPSSLRWRNAEGAGASGGQKCSLDDGGGIVIDEETKRRSPFSPFLAVVLGTAKQSVQPLTS
jgi:hypothetical protein